MGDERGGAATATPGAGWSERDGADADEPVPHPGELMRIEGALAAVRAELDQLRILDDARLRARVAAMERTWRDELEAIVPRAVAGELHGLVDWTGDEGASAGELRIGLAQLAGWVEGFISALGLVVQPDAPPTGSGEA